MKRAAIDRVERIALAGAFGSIIDPQFAMLLGLIPDCPLENVTAVGNAAGDGARIALLNRGKREEAARIARQVNYIETAVDPEFQNEFVGAIHIPHATDAFPNLESRLGASLPRPPSTNDSPRRERRAGRIRNRQTGGEV
jgi:uncharacterized 2Fe-2S/4Fe-4S cluster protein (DUF4445 family)